MGETKAHLQDTPPVYVLGMAEEVSPEILYARMRRNETRRKPTGLFYSAWSYTEYALGRQLAISEAERKWHFELAQNLTGHVINHSDTTQDTRLGAKVLSTYLPLFNKRCFNDEITNEDVREVYASLAAAMDFLQPLSIDEPPQWRMTETAVLALAARTGQSEFLLYPGSPREEASCVQRLNHDSYFLAEGKIKLPTQQKLMPTTKEYDPSVTMVILAPILEKALIKQYGMNEYTESEMIHYLIGAIIAESVGKTQSVSETKLLNHLSEAVVSHYYLALNQNVA